MLTSILTSLSSARAGGLSPASASRDGFVWRLLPILAFAMALASVTVTLSASATKLYRYKDAAGGWVIASRVPNDRVALGYQVLDETGRVIELVEPQRSPEEAAAILAQVEKQRQREEAIRRINLLYGSEADISYALEKAIDSIDKSLANTQANVRQLSSQLKRLETQAARIERAGNLPSQEMIVSIAALGDRINNLEAEVAQRLAQKDVERQRHARDRQLFREVHGADAGGVEQTSAEGTGQALEGV